MIDHRYLTFLAGKKITPEIFGIYELERLSEIRPEEIQDYIENNNITLIAYRNQFIEKDPFWQSHMQKNYELIDTITYYDYVNVNVWKIYSKR